MLYILSTLRKQNGNQVFLVLVIHKSSCNEVTESSLIFILNLHPYFPKVHTSWLQAVNMGYRDSWTIAALSLPWNGGLTNNLNSYTRTQIHTEALRQTTSFMSEAECSINTLSKTELYSLKLDTSSMKKGCICRNIGRGGEKEGENTNRREKDSEDSWSVKWSSSFLIWFRLRFGNAMKQQLQT